MKHRNPRLWAWLAIGCLLHAGCTAQNRPQSNHTTKCTPMNTETSSKTALNVLGEPLMACCFEPQTGFYRDGFCHTGSQDMGTHTVCAVMTEDFLAFTKSRGNDLSTAIPQYGFPGLKPGDKWCLCASRWHEAHRAGHAPKVLLSATHIKTLEYVTLEVLKTYQITE